MKSVMKWLIALLVLPTLWACDSPNKSGGDGSQPPPPDPSLQTILLDVTPVVLDATTVQARQRSAARTDTLTLQFKAFGVYSSGVREDITEQVEWLSSDPSLATFVSPGVAEVSGVGEVAIRARQGALTSEPFLFARWLGDPTALEVTPARVTLAVGSEVALATQLVYRDGIRFSADDAVSWASDDTAIATVSGEGRVQGRQSGQATLTASAAGLSTAVPVNVTAESRGETARVVSMRIEPAVIDLALLSSQSVRAIAQYSDGVIGDITAGVTWTLTDATVAALTDGPAVRGLKAGTTQLVGRYDNVVSPPATVTVRPAELVSLAVLPQARTLPAGVETDVQLLGTYADNTQALLTEGVTLRAADPDTVSVLSPTRVRALRAGQTTLVASVGSLTSEPVTLDVTAAELRTLTLTDSALDLPLGARATLTVVGAFSDGQVLPMTDQVTLSSSDSNVLQALSAGEIVARAIGTATVTAFSDQIASNTVTVTVSDAAVASIQVQASQAQIPVGLTEQFKAFANYTDGTVVDVSAQALWDLSDEGVYAAHLGAGEVRGLAPGASTLRARFADMASDPVPVSVTSAVVTAIQITPPSATLAAGNQQAFTATGTYSDGSTEDITRDVLWRTDAPTVARFGADNVLTSAIPGEVQVTASLGDQLTSAPVTVTVTEAKLAAVQINPDPLTLPLGRSGPISVIGTYTDGSSADITHQVPFWLISNPFVASVNTDGSVLAVGQGSTSVAARFVVDGETLIASTTVNVTAAVLERIEAQTTAGLLSVSLPNGTSAQLQARAYYSDGSSVDTTYQADWQSSASGVVEAFTTGLVAARGVGEATVIATFGGISSDPVTVSVTQATLQELIVTPPAVTTPLGVVVQMQADGLFTDGSRRTITDDVEWESDAPGVIIAGPFGDMYPMAPGQARITARTREGLVNEATITVTAAALQSIQVTPSPVALPRGITRQMTAVGNYTDGSTQDLSAVVSWNAADTDVASVNGAGVLTGVAQGSTTLQAVYGGVSSDPVAIAVSDPVLEQIQIIPDTTSLSVGLTRGLTATGVYSDDSTADLTNSVQWISSAPTVAGVSASGVVTARQQGTATITARFEFVSGTAAINVTAAQLTAIAVTGAPASLASGNTAQLVATGNYTDGSTADISTQVTWSTSAPTVLRVSNSGLITGLAQGTSSVHASLSGITSNDAFVTVTSAVLVSMSTTPEEVTLARGTSRAISVQGYYSDNQSVNLTSTAAWQSQNPTIATVDNNGVVRGVNVGTAIIVASRDGVTSNPVQVTVTAAQLSSITVMPTSLTLPRGVSNILSATGSYTDGSTQDVTTQVSWLSQDTTIATVSTTGRVTGANVGQTSVRASFGGVTSNQVPVQVTQAQLTSLAITPQPVAVAQGRTQQMVATGTYSDGSTQVLTNAVAWRSSNTSLLTVNSTGLMSGVFVGQATVFASQGGIEANAPVKIEQGPSIASVGTGLTVPKGGTSCLTDGFSTSAYDLSCVFFKIDFPEINFGWTVESTQITLATNFTVPLKSITFTGYFRMMESQNPGALGYWQVLGCDDANCVSQTPLTQHLLIAFFTRMDFPYNTRAYPFYRVVFRNGPVSNGGGSGSANFSEVVYGF